jgi:hypothetical protein
MSKYTRGRFLSVCIAALGAFWLVLSVGPLVGPAMAANENPGVLPPNSRPLGKTYGDWSAAWWQYVFSIPQADNPLLDPSGAKCQVGQSGDVFFLVGSILGTANAVTRSCVVPAGKFLFFPLVNLEDNLAEETAGNLVGLPVTAVKMAALLNCLVAGGTTPFGPPFSTCAGTTSLNASIDDRPLRDLFGYRAVSPTFSIVVPPSPNLEDAFGYSNISGTVAPVVADGFYLMLVPLSPGAHTVKFGGTLGSPLDTPLSEITYRLTVAQ